MNETELETYLIAIRRHLHQYPELSFEEEKTPKFIAEYHESLGHEVRTNVGGRGVLNFPHTCDNNYDRQAVDERSCAIFPNRR